MITVRDLVKTFGGIRAVDGCNLTVPQGSITGLIGPNGAGKTTLFNIIAGFMRPNSGCIELAGHDVTGLASHQLVRLGLVRTFQIPHTFDRMTVLESLMVVPGEQLGESIFPAWLRWGAVQRQERELRRRAMEVVEFLQLREVRHELAGNLSGGQKKLLELGRAMISEARVVLLDEPGAGVNPTLLAKLTDNILRLNREFGYTFCVVEHDMDVIAKLCHPIIVMIQGKVVAEGSMEEIRRNEEVVAAYLGGGMAAAPARDSARGSRRLH